MEKFSSVNLAKMLRGMNAAKRTQFLDDLLDYSPETKALRQEVRKVEKTVGKKVVDRGGIKLSGTFLSLGGSLLVVMTIREIISDNYFENNIYNPMTDAKYQQQLLQQIFNFYTSERSNSEIIQNPLVLLEVFDIAVATNQYLDELGIEENTEKTQEQINSFLNRNTEEVNLDKIRLKTGTL